MGSSNDDTITELKKRGDIEDVQILKVHDRYRLHLNKDFRRLFDIDEGDRLIIVKDGPSDCPYCKKSLKLPGSRMFVQKKGNFAVIIEVDKSLQAGACINLS